MYEDRGNTTGPMIVREQPTLPIAMKELDQRLGMLCERMGMLSARLEPVRTPQMDGQQPTASTPPKVAVPVSALTAQIRQQVEIVEHLLGQVDMMLKELEL